MFPPFELSPRPPCRSSPCSEERRIIAIRRLGLTGGFRGTRRSRRGLEAEGGLPGLPVLMHPFQPPFAPRGLRLGMLPQVMTASSLRLCCGLALLLGASGLSFQIRRYQNTRGYDWPDRVSSCLSVTVSLAEIAPS
jgi:hypothetical protein